MHILKTPEYWQSKFEFILKFVNENINDTMLLTAAGTRRTHPHQVPPQTSLWHHLRPAAKQTPPVTTEKSPHQIARCLTFVANVTNAEQYLHISCP